MSAKIKKNSPKSVNPKKTVKANGVEKKNKKPKDVKKSTKFNGNSVEPANKNVSAGKHIVFDDDNDEPIPVAPKKVTKKESKENARDIGRRWYEEVNIGNAILDT